MEKRKNFDFGPFICSKRKRLAPEFNEVPFEFDSEGQNDGFEEEIAQGGHFKSAEFWESQLVKNTGTVLLRPSFNDFSDQAVYYLKRSYKQNENKTTVVKPSIVELERRHFPEVKAWLEQRFIEHREAKPGAMIALLEEHKEFAIPKKNLNGALPENFFRNPLTLVLGEFRRRVHFNDTIKATVYTFNSERSYGQNTAWNGPTISGVAVGEVKRILRVLTEFEENF